MLVIVALLAGNKVGGFIGMIAAVPMAALIKVWFERFIEMKRKERCGRGQLDKDDTVDYFSFFTFHFIRILVTRSPTRTTYMPEDSGRT